MSATDPRIVPRAQWGADPLVTPATNIPVPTAELWLHHSAGEQFGAQGMRLLQAFTLHRPDAHYSDLEYSFVVDHADCSVYESRGPGRNTAATYLHNGTSHAICVMGNFQNDPVSPQLVETLANLVAWGYEQGWWPLGFTGGHRDASGNSTACPGNHLEAVIPEINARAAAIHAGPVVNPPHPPGPGPTPVPLEDDVDLFVNAKSRDPLRPEFAWIDRDRREVVLSLNAVIVGEKSTVTATEKRVPIPTQGQTIRGTDGHTDGCGFTVVDALGHGYVYRFKKL